MTPEAPQWSEIEDLFFKALELPADRRETWLTEAAGTRSALAKEVRTLLWAHEASEAAAPLRRIGAYLLERRIGRGGMGEVWLASRADGQFEKRVAIKLVRAGPGADLLLSGFHRERRLLARLEHPGIARLIDGGVASDGRPYLAMEYVEGEPLLDFCENRGLPLRARIELFLRLCAAVDYAHRNLIVHRDIKPGNVLVTEDGLPKLLDFGIARLIESEPTDTATTTGLLTPRYASPEQLRGDAVGTATDVYSLGVLLFELLTGSLPYEVHGKAPAQMAVAIANREARLASRVSLRVRPGDLDAILSKALEKNPADRYGSVERFAGELENYLSGRPVMARRQTAGYRLGKYLRRHWAGTAAACTIAIALAATAAISLRAAHLAKLQEERGARVTRFLEDMLASVDPGWEGTAASAGGDVRVLDLLPAAEERIATAFADDPATRARLHRVLARAYTNLQHFPEAEAQMRRALALLPSLRTDPAERARIMFAAGDLDFLLSHRVEEERELREALEIFEHTPELAADATEHAIFAAKLAEALADVGKKRESVEYADRAADVAAAISSPFPVRTGIVHTNLVLSYMKVGRLERARSEARLAVRFLSLSPKPLNELAQVYMWLGIVERLLGNPADSLTAAERSVDAAVRATGATGTLTVAPRIELAYAQALTGDFRRALPELNRCLAQARAGSSEEDLFHALHSLGYALTLAGQAREGEAPLREAIETGPHFLAKDGPSMGICSLEFGECLERLGRGEEARRFYRIAYDNLLSYYGPVYVTRQALTRLRRLSSPE